MRHTTAVEIMLNDVVWFDYRPDGALAGILLWDRKQLKYVYLRAGVDW